MRNAQYFGNGKFGGVLTASYTAQNAADENKDKYRWYVSENGANWTLIENADKKTYKIGIESIKKQIKCEVSVAGNEGSYSTWYECDNAISDQTTMVEMINALQSEDYSGKNAKMLELLKKFDVKYMNYKFGVCKVSQLVRGTYFINLDGECTLLPDEMLIGNIKVNTNGRNINEFVGTEVNAYIYADGDDDRYTLMYICSRGKSSTHTISARDALGLKNGVFRYSENKRTKTLDMSKELTVMKNGAYLFNYTDDEYTDFSAFDFRMERIQTIYSRIDKVGDFIRLSDGNKLFVIRKATLGHMQSTEPKKP